MVESGASGAVAEMEVLKSFYVLLVDTKASAAYTTPTSITGKGGGFGCEVKLGIIIARRRMSTSGFCDNDASLHMTQDSDFLIVT